MAKHGKWSELRQVRDWPEQAHEGGYSVGIVADRFGVSIADFEEYVKAEHGECPHGAFSRWRRARISKLARQTGRHWLSGEQVAQDVGLCNRSNLSRWLRQEAGCTLAELRNGARKIHRRNDNKPRPSSGQAKGHPLAGQPARTRLKCPVSRVRVGAEARRISPRGVLGKAQRLMSAKSEK